MTDDRVTQLLRRSAETHRMAEVIVRCLVGGIALVAVLHGVARMGWL